jgi:hypothetical protein
MASTVDGSSYAERRAATWLYAYCTGELSSGEADVESWECELSDRALRRWRTVSGCADLSAWVLCTTALRGAW